MTEKFDEFELGLIAAGVALATNGMLRSDSANKGSRDITIAVAMRISKKVLDMANEYGHSDLIEAAELSYKKVQEIVTPYVMANSAKLN